MSARQTITAVDCDAKDPGLVRVRIGRLTVGPLRRDAAERLGLDAGRAWTARLARQVERLAQCEGCHADALRRLGRRDHSRELLVSRLTPRWGEEIAREIVEQLASHGWIDDGAYAMRRAESLRRAGPVSSELVAARLETEGVPARTARKAAGDGDRAQDLAVHMRRWKREGRTAVWITRTLGRRGFEFDTIADALRGAGLPCPSED
jgi:SOS response regulatory protein OraA/RecX